MTDEIKAYWTCDCNGHNRRSIMENKCNSCGRTNPIVSKMKDFLDAAAKEKKAYLQKLIPNQTEETWRCNCNISNLNSMSINFCCVCGAWRPKKVNIVNISNPDIKVLSDKIDKLTETIIELLKVSTQKTEFELDTAALFNVDVNNKPKEGWISDLFKCMKIR